ncbi:MAG: substrate-binding domain-containing protein [Leptolyngbya sp. SIO1E4]|nr:substrate-binding domain-containing protein [Leptolyngbya sp. SIO1E4]
MVKLRNRSLLVLLLLVACMAPPAMARPQTWWWLAQVNPDSSDPVSPEPPPEAAPTPEPEEEAPPPAAEPPAAETEAPNEPPAEPAEPADESEPVPPAPAPGGEVPPELTPTFNLPESLPEGTVLSIEGSSSMAVITRTLLERFQQSYVGATVNLVEQPTDVALQNLQTGTADLAAIARPLTDEEEAQGLTAVSVSREKIALIVSQDNPFQGNVDSATFVQIFRGEITNWNQIGGPDLPIRLIDRPVTSDTRRALGDYELFGGDLTTGGDVVQLPNDSTAEVVDALGNNGISYAIASQVLDQDNVRVLPMHGTLPDDPRYPYSQPRNFVYQVTTPLPMAIEAFLAFATNPEGQAAVAQAKAAEAADVAAAELPDHVAAMRPNGEGFVTGTRAGRLNFWNADGTSSGDPVDAHTGPITALAFSPDGQRLISGGADGTIRFWDAVGTPIGDPINGGNGPVTSLVVQPDGTFISASTSGTLQRWDDTGNPVGEPISGHEDTVRDMALTPDGQTLITASKDGTIRQWNTADATPKGEPIGGHEGAVQTLAVKPDGSFASGGVDGTVRQWDATGAAVGEPSQASGPVTALAANPDGTSLAVGDETGSLQLLAGDGTTAAAPITDIGAAIDDLAFTPDGERLVVSAGETPQIRDRTGQRLPAPDSEAADQPEEAAPFALPPELLNLWQRLQQLPPQTLWMIPIAVLALLLLGLLRSWQDDEEDDFDEDEVAGALPGGTDTDLPPTGGRVAGLTPEEASVSLDTNLGKARQALAEGVTLAKANRHSEALNAFSTAIESADLERLKASAAGVGLVGAGAVIAQALSRRGATLLHLGRSDEALQNCNRALEMDPNEIVAWISKGHLMAETGRLDEAIFCFDKAIELNPNIAATWQGKGDALQKMGRDAEARTCFAQAQELGGEDGSIPLDLIAPIAKGETAHSAASDVLTPEVLTPEETIPEEEAGEITPEVLPPEEVTLEAAVPESEPIMPEPVTPEPEAAAPGVATTDDEFPLDADEFPLNADEFPLDADEFPLDTVDEQPSPEPPPATFEPEEDVPPEFQDVIPPFPEIADQPTPPAQAAPPTPEPAEAAAIAPTPPPPIESEIPSELLQAVEYLPEEPDSPDPRAAATPPIEVPPEVNDILADQSTLPSTEEAASVGAVTVEAAEESDIPDSEPEAEVSPEVTVPPPPPRATVVKPPPPPPRPPQLSAPETAATPDQPDDSGVDVALAGVPPEVLEALKGIPGDSPDSFNLPSETPVEKKPPPHTPPPPPSNPRLRKPPT